MRKSLFLMIVLFFAAAAPAFLSAAEFKYQKEAGQIKITVPAEAKIRQYLGINEKEGKVLLPQLRQGILIVEIFNMYCPHCQHYAPVVNQLYNKINSRPDTKSRVMLIGIGVGNSPFEVDIFRKKYNIGFPLFDDKAYSVATKLEGVLTPYFMAMTLDGKGGYKMFFSKNGGFDDADAFLNELLKLSVNAQGR